jgi:thioredoxin-dependent peroxiredoxin
MAKVNLKGNPVMIKGDLAKPGEKAKDFKFVKPDLTEGTLFGLGEKVKVILAVPSLDTGVCAMETRKFNEKLAGFKEVIGLVVSRDLPYAIRRFCELEGIKNVIGASDFRNGEFINKYNTEIMEGGMKGLSCRAVFVLNKENIVQYTELVPEISQEPDYQKAIDAVTKLI